MINRVILVGRMTKDPEIRRTGGGSAVTSFTLAADRGFESHDGQTADFIPVVCWNKTAENVERYCSKGSLVGVDGRLRSRSYDNNQGQRVFVVEVQADSVQFLETRAARERQQAIQQNQVQRDNFYHQPAQQTQPNYYNQATPSQTDYYDIRTVDTTAEFDSYNIMEDDIGF